MTGRDATDSVGCVTTMSTEGDRLGRIRWCDCGQPWIPAGGLYGTTEELSCQACTLRRMRTEERGVPRPGLARAIARALPDEARRFALRAVAICQSYAAEHPEHANAAADIAVRITQEARK